MKLRTKFILVISILHVVAIVLSTQVFRTDKVLFFASEVLILISLIISWQLYQQMLRPLQTLVDGIEAIKSEDFNVKFLRTGTYEIDEMIEVYNQMMDHLKMERTRQEQQHFFLEKLIQTSPTGILILDFDERIQQVNPKAAAMLNITEQSLLQQSITSLPHSLLQEISRLQSGEGKTVSLDGIHTYKLQRSHFIDRGFARSFVMIEELTVEILAAEKNAYGKVIRMMAHEVNNTIGPVNSILDSAVKTKEMWESKHDALRHALTVALDRNQNLNIFMRNFADVVRLPAPHKTEVNLHQLVRSVATLFRLKAAEANIIFQFNTTEEPFYIHADQQQLEQAIINIVKNAIEAIGSNGTITFNTYPADQILAVSDTGAGVSQEHAAQLFSPFFSTKKDGQGVGLTLVKEILLNHGCVFSLQTSSPGRTTFQMQFPKGQ